MSSFFLYDCILSKLIYNHLFITANVAVARSYLSSATLVSERTRAVAIVSLAQVLGFVVGPALQAAAAPLGPGPPYPPPGDYSIPLRLDMYTAAGWINAVLGFVNFLLFLPWCFKEKKIAAREAMIAQGTDSGKCVPCFNLFLMYNATCRVENGRKYVVGNQAIVVFDLTNQCKCVI